MSTAFSPDGKHMASCLDNKTARMWDVETGKAVKDSPPGHTAQLPSIAFHLAASIRGAYINIVW